MTIESDMQVLKTWSDGTSPTVSRLHAHVDIQCAYNTTNLKRKFTAERMERYDDVDNIWYFKW